MRTRDLEIRRVVDQRESRASCPLHVSQTAGLLVLVLILAMAALAGPVSAASGEDGATTKPAFQRRGFYLHACWKYNYPFAVRSWQRADYQNFFRLLKRLGFNTVMLWPVLEAVPAPLSPADREAVRAFRPIIDDARKCGLEVWLTQCAAVVSQPEIAAKPWLERSLYPHMKTVRLDNPQEAADYLHHRAALMEILNNADGYVTIDGDPGGYPGAKPSEFLKVLLNDRKTIDRVGIHPKAQKVIPWIWCGWGAKGVWAEPIAPFVSATLDALKQRMPEPWELLPGRSREGHANDRINIELARKAGLIDRSTLFLYEAIEFEPSPPAAVLQLADIRDALTKELAESAGARGVFGNAQQPIMVLPNLYFFARGSADPSYLDQPDEKVLGDFARFLGGPSELLVPAWSCLNRGLDELPAELPARLRAAKLTDPAALLLPGGAPRYLEILAAQVDCRIRLLRACGQPAKTPQEAAKTIADGTAALVDWWKLHGYIGDGEGNEPFRWRFVNRTQYGLLKAWGAKNVADPRLVSKLAANEIVRQSVLTEPTATGCMRKLLGQ